MDTETVGVRLCSVEIANVATELRDEQRGAKRGSVRIEALDIEIGVPYDRAQWCNGPRYGFGVDANSSVWDLHDDGSPARPGWLDSVRHTKGITWVRASGGTDVA
jgi:hypothetical protein